jgi:uncharacterized membrane protein HdeD (DUF308 family)
MTRTLARSWWLLLVCGVLEALIAFLNLLMQDPSGSIILRKFALESTVVFQGGLAVVAGACALAAGTWCFADRKSWLLVLNGLAFGAYGLISVFWSRGRLAFLPVALLFVVMALSLGILAWTSALTLGRRADKWLFGLAGCGSMCFALAFLAWGFGWVSLDGPGSYFLWSSSFFGLSAICMIGLGLHLNGEQTTLPTLASGTFPAV